MLPLSKRQHEVKAFIAKYVKRHKISPTLDEISKGIGANFGNTRRLVRELERRGHATRIPGMWRSLQLVPERPVI
jgi:SOS-response transcriptional repressor LexA